MTIPDEKTLDFVVIGAPKAATTTLYALLKDHPELSLPAAKEAPFFSEINTYNRGFRRYLDQEFGKADPDTLWGTVTPHYMQGNEVRVDVVAKRMASDVPACKLIAMLRDPVERAFSHYKMRVLGGYERRSFEEVVSRALVAPDKHRRGLRAQSDPYSFLFVSEYGRILRHFYDRFPRENILVLTTNRLQDAPLETVGAICRFLGIDDGYTPEGTGVRHREGGTKPKVRFLTPGFLYSIPLVQWLWTHVVPGVLRRRIQYRINLWNRKPGSTATLDRGSAACRNLEALFAKDNELLESLTGQPMPWSLNRSGSDPGGP